MFIYLVGFGFEVSPIHFAIIEIKFTILLDLDRLICMRESCAAINMVFGPGWEGLCTIESP